MKKIALAIALIGSVGIVGNVLAQDKEVNPSWYVAPSISKFNPDNRFGVDGNGNGLGLRFGKPVSEFWDFQVGATTAKASHLSNKFKQETLSADALLMLSRSSIRPFLLIGAGIESDKATGVLMSKRNTAPFIEAGLGIQADFSENWSFQADIRRLQGKINNNSFNFDQSKNTYFNIGLNYVFDKVIKKAPVVIAPPPAPEPAPEPVVAPPPPPPALKFEKVTLSSTELFGFDSDVLGSAQPKLDEMATVLKANETIKNVAINGYTDRLGSDKYNMTLSEKRANAVKTYLVNKGISADRLTAVGKGETNPVVECKMKKRAELIQCLEPNRRVEVEEITFQRRVK